MGLLSFNPGERVVYRTLTDKILEWSVIILMICLWGLAVYFWNILPDKIPVHFDFSGTPNGWGNKNQLFLITGIGTLVTIALGVGAYYPKIIQVPVKLRPECLSVQYVMIGRLARVSNVLVALMFIFSVLAIIMDATGNPVKLLWATVGGINILLLIYMLVYSLKITRYGQRFGG